MLTQVHNCRIIAAFKRASSGAPLSQIHDVNKSGIVITKTWPAPKDTTAPDAVPANISRFYEQAADSLRVGNLDTAGVMFRKVLETSSKEKIPSARDKPLVKRIDMLADAGLITSDMKLWAHEIRLGGNDAAHDEEPFTKADAERLEAFCNAFLQYAYTLPELVASGCTSAKT